MIVYILEEWDMTREYWRPVEVFEDAAYAESRYVGLLVRGRDGLRVREYESLPLE